MVTSNNRDNYDQKKLREVYLDLKQTGDLAFIAGDYGKALNLYNQALAMANLVENNLMLGLILSSIANTYARKGDTERAIEFYGRGANALDSIRHRDALITEALPNFSDKEVIRREEQWRREEEMYRKEENERISLRRRSYLVIAFFGISLLALVIGLIFFLITRNPVILLSLEIPVIFFTLVTFFGRRLLFRPVERPHST